MAIIQNVELKTCKGKLIYTCIFIFLVIGTFIQIYPFFWMIMGTFKSDNELISAIPSLFPEKWSIEAYIQTFAKYNLWNNILNTIVLCASMVALQVGNSAIAAYSLSKMRPRFGKQILLFFLATMMFSGTVLLFPLYIMMSQMNLIGSKLALVLSSSVWAYSIYLFKSFFDNVPAALTESAKVDGASSIRTFFTIIIPLSKPIFTVNILNTFMAVYNDFLYPLMLLPNEKDWTIMMRIFNLDRLGSAPPSHMYVLLVTAVIPILFIYLFAQRYIVEGISTSGIKG